MVLSRRRRLSLHQPLQVWGFTLPKANAHAADAILRISNLHKTESVAAMGQSHGLGVDCQAGHFQIALGPCRIEIAIKDGELSGRGARISHDVEPDMGTV